MCITSLMNLEKVAEVMGVTVAVVADLISCGDLVAVGSTKQFVKLCDLNRFLGISTEDTTTDFQLPIPPSLLSNEPAGQILIEDISESEWFTMEKKGIKEHRPYFDQQKQRWCIALSLGKTADGRRKRKVISGVTQADVWDAYRQFMAQQKKDEVAPIAQDTPIVTKGIATQLGLATYRPEQDVLFSECYAKFLKGIESGIVNRTYGGYVAASKYIVEKLGHLKMYELNREVIQDFFNDLRNAKYAKGKEPIPTHFYGQSRLNLTYDLLHKFILEYSNEGAGNGILSRDFMAGMKKPATNALKSDETVPCKPDEIKRVLAAVQPDKMISCWVHILAEIGCRPSEALALQWSDVDYEKGTIRITKTLGKNADFDPVTLKRISKYWAKIKNLKNETGRAKHRNYQRRTLRVSTKTLSVIKEWQDTVSNNKELLDARKKYNTQDQIFTGPKGDLRIYDDYSQRYERLLDKANLDHSEFFLYRFRHTVCTDLLKSGVDLKTVQLIMGDNTSDMILRVYANITQDDVLNSSTSLSERMVDIVRDGQTVANE